ncbi:MAG TPA: CTP synthase [Acidobacteriota bacterium]|nr:CTP synthase [Acidobacteriota bacterium]
MEAKYIFVTGGVVSSLGKGLASACIGSLLESMGYTIAMQKLDPYLNVDPGTMSPFQHGEVFVTDDGAETDLDLGHYERFTTYTTCRDSNFTTGQVYEAVIEKERRGDYLGKTVQVIPHITDELKASMRRLENGHDFIIIEIGGTVGDIEGQPFLEAIRQMRIELGRERTLFVHLTLVPFIKAANELKTKPTQHSVKELREIGIQPDILICRSDRPLPDEVKAKIALFCNVKKEAVITSRDLSCIYEAPLMFEEDGLSEVICERLKLEKCEADLTAWHELSQKINNPKDTVEIAIVGKYVDYEDSYKSLIEALHHGGYAHDLRTVIRWVEAEGLEGPEADVEGILGGADGILVPGGFGGRGIEGMIVAIRHARESNTPFFGICLGMQCSVIEFARYAAKLKGAHSTEFDSDTSYPVIFMLRDLLGVEEMGGTMRLGAYECQLREGSKAHKAYNEKVIWERHRHRYEFNHQFTWQLEDNGMVITGKSPDGKFVEMTEVENHPWFVGCQFHPEFKSRPLNPHPLFRDFIGASYKNKTKEA